MEILCEDCEYFCPFPEYNNEMGQCRMKPPAIVKIQLPDNHDDEFKTLFYEGRWPEVDHKTWCGKFKHKDHDDHLSLNI
jgi:hypothetical protein